MLSSAYSGEVSQPARSGDLPQAYRVHPWAYSAIRAIANAIADVPIVVVGTTKPGKAPLRQSFSQFKKANGIENWGQVKAEFMQKQQARVYESHELLDLLADPLPEANLTQHELLQAIVTYLELSGNAFVEKIFDDNKKQKIHGLWPKIDPRSVIIIPGKTKLVDGYIYCAGISRKVFDDSDIIHFMYFNPENPYYGLSPTEVVKTTLSSDLRALDWNRMFFENDATPAGYISLTGSITRDQANVYREQFEQKHQGFRKAHRVSVFGDGGKYVPVSPTHREMGYLDMLKFSIDQISAAYGVPKMLLGLRQGITRGTAYAELEIFYVDCILPRLDKIESMLNIGLNTKEQGVRLMFDISSVHALREDVELKAQIGKDLATQGYTVGELREYHGLKKAEGPLVDAVMIPNNVAIAGYVGGKPEQDVDETILPIDGQPDDGEDEEDTGFTGATGPEDESNDTENE
jgi:HK97 family phage portal protein